MIGETGWSQACPALKQNFFKKEVLSRKKVIQMPTIKGNLIMDKDMVFDEDLIVKGSIIGKGGDGRVS